MGSIDSSSQDAPTDKLDPIFTTKRTLKVVCIGAGASGLYLAYKLQRHFDDFELHIFEKNPDVAGTWYENRYPGCACDVPAHVYTYTFEPKIDWSRYYAESKEILGYFQDFAKKYSLLKYVKFCTEVVAAKWDEDASLWSVTATDKMTGEKMVQACHILVNASGNLNSWNWPDIKGLKSFQGELAHSADWDESLSVKGKKVGLIGNGSSGIQILPAILPEVSEITTFIRASTWIASPMGVENPIYTEAQKEEFSRKPEVHIKLRKEIEDTMNMNFPFLLRNTDMARMMKDFMINQMNQRIVDDSLRKHLIPDWSPGCRRVTAGAAYLEALKDPKAKLVKGSIDHVTEKGVVMDNGIEYPVDVLICATGFNTSYMPRFPLIGPEKDLDEVWKDGPRAYYGLAAPEIPNYFMTLGPNAPVGSGSVIPVIESQVDYFVTMMAKFQKENIKSFTLIPEVTDEILQVVDKFMEKTVWTEDCRSWYKHGTTSGRVTALWPGSILHYREAIKEPRYEDWKFKYYGNRFEFLGNFMSSAERRIGDYSPYICQQDNTPIDPCLKKQMPKTPINAGDSGLDVMDGLTTV